MNIRGTAILADYPVKKVVQRDGIWHKLWTCQTILQGILIGSALSLCVFLLSRLMDGGSLTAVLRKDQMVLLSMLVPAFAALCGYAFVLHCKHTLFVLLSDSEKAIIGLFIDRPFDCLPLINHSLWGSALELKRKGILSFRRSALIESANPYDDSVSPGLQYCIVPSAKSFAEKNRGCLKGYMQARKA